MIDQRLSNNIIYKKNNKTKTNKIIKIRSQNYYISKF